MKFKKCLNLISIPILFFLCGFFSIVMAQDNSFSETFDDPVLPGWEKSPGAAVSDGILRIEPGNFAIYPASWGEMEIHVMMRLEGGGESFFTYRMGDGSGYQTVFGTDYMRLVREHDGGSTVLGSTEPFPVPLGDWFHLIVLSSGNNQTVLVNDEVVFEALDTEPLPPGGIGFEAHGGMSLEVNELTIFSLGEGIPPEEEPPLEEEPTPTQAAESVPEPPLQPTGDLTWVRTGGPPGGIGYDIRYKFDDPKTWYVTDNFAGVHISTDNGLTWQASNQGIPGQMGPTGDWTPIFSLTVDPHKPDTIWAGTDKTGHIYKSTDGGLTWSQKDNGVSQVTDMYDALSFRGFTIDPIDPNTVYAMGEIADLAEGGANVWGTAVGGIVYKTTDGGENWEVLWDGGIPSSLARYMWINPEDTNIMYVSTGIFDRGAVNEGLETDPNPYGGLGILKSTDSGQTWRVLNETNGLNFLYVGSLFMHPEDPNILLAASGKVTAEKYIDYLKENNLQNPMGVYRTTDGGESWTQVLVEGGSDAVEICSSDTNIAYAANANTVYRSEDAGMTWTQVAGQGGNGWGPPGVLAGTPIDLQCDPRNPDLVFSNNYLGGNFLSKDGGKTWINASDGYTGAQTTSLAVDPNDPAQIFLAGRNGIWGSSNAGGSWYGLRYPPQGVPVWGGEWGGITVDPGNSDHLLASEETVWESFDSGVSWEVRQTPAYAKGSSIVFTPSDPKIVYMGRLDPICVLNLEAPCGQGNGVYVSRDGGTSWEYANDTNVGDLMVIDLAVDPFDSQVVYIATMKGVYKTTDGGAKWSSMAGLPDQTRVNVITIHAQDSKLLLAGVESHGLYQSTDGGDSWQQIVAGLQPNSSIRDVVYDPTNTQVVYLSDLMSGVYQSEEGGQTWTQINQGLTNRAATGLGISADGQHLYLATSGEGIFRLDLNGQPPETGIPSKFETEVETPLQIEEAAPIRNSGLLIGIGVVLVVIFVVVVVVLSRRKTG